MQNACNTSPFLKQEEALPWFLWQRKIPADDLTPREQTDSRFVLEMERDDPPTKPPVQPGILTIQRRQYNAVLSRMDQASRKTGTYANWSP